MLEKLNQIIPPQLYAPAVFIAWLLTLWLMKRFVIYRLKKWASKTSQLWDDVVIDAISFPANFLILASGLKILSTSLSLPDKADRFMTISLQGCVIVAIVVFLDRFIKAMIDLYASNGALSGISHGLMKGVIRSFIMGIGVLIFLDLIGISITPILASLGIGSLAVALALQDTLSNFFAGIYVAVDKPVGIGGYVRLETGDEGYVIDIGWRNTRIRTVSNNVVVIPNSKLIGSAITNFHLPEKEIVVTVEVGVHYDSNLEQVETVTLEAARQVLKGVSGAVPEFEPVIRFHTFEESSINFTVTLKAKEVTDSHFVKSEFIKVLHERYRREGIIIPYPIRTLELSAKAPLDLKKL